MKASMVVTACLCDVCKREDEVNRDPQVKAMRVLWRTLKGNKAEAAEVRHYIRRRKEELRNKV